MENNKDKSTKNQSTKDKQNISKKRARIDSESSESPKNKRKKEDDADSDGWADLDEATLQMLKQFYNLTQDVKPTSTNEQQQNEGRIKVERFYMIEPKLSPFEQEQKLLQRILDTEAGSTTLTNFSEDMKNNFNDGKRIFVNRIRFYKNEEIEEHMISFKQLCYKDMGFISGKLCGKVQVKTAIVTTMVFEMDVLAPLIDAKIPITVFLDRNRNEPGPQVEYSTALNMNLVYQQKWGQLDYGVFHPKLMLFEFDDRLRVIVSSANLYVMDWEMLSQVIWFQDFFPMTKEQLAREEPDEFRNYLSKFMTDIYPRNVSQREVYRQKINLNKYNFQNASASLVGSVNGRHKINGDQFERNGQNRLGALCESINKDEKIITYQTSSLGKLNTRFLTQFYNQFGHKKKQNSDSDISNNFRIIYPTEGHVQTSNLGMKHASSIILNEEYFYGGNGFPVNSFYQQLTRKKHLEGNLYHAKFFIVNSKKNDNEITDDTVIYIGSHNFSGGAWGNLEKADTQIAIANWELGIVFPPQIGSKEMKEKIIKEQLVLKYPPEKYSESDYPYFMR